MIKNLKTFLKAHSRAVVASVAVSLIYNLPTLLGFVINTKGKYFSGQNSWFDPWDMNVYFSAIRWSQQNNFSFRNMYSTINNDSPTFYPLYTLAGTIFKNVEATVLYAVLNTLAGTGLALSIYFSAFLLTKNRVVALMTQILTSFGGGFGWIMGNFIASPDLYITPFTFVSAYQKSHEALAVSIMLFVYSALFRASKTPRVFVVAAGLVSLCVFYPFYILSVPLVIFVFSLISNNRKLLKTMIIVVLISLPPVGIYSYTLSNSYTLSSVIHQSFAVILPQQIFLGYGLLLILSGVILFISKKGQTDRLDKFIFTWFAVSLTIALIPGGIGKFYLRGLFFPLSLYIAKNWKSLGYLRESYRFTFLNILIISSLTTIFILTARFYSLYSPADGWTYLSPNDKAGLTFAANLPPSNIMAPYRISNLIAGLTNNSVFAGHTIQTPDFAEKRKLQSKVFEEEYSQTEAYNLLAANNINYLISPREITKYPFLIKKSADGYFIYKVVRNSE